MESLGKKVKKKNKIIDKNREDDALNFEFEFPKVIHVA